VHNVQQLVKIPYLGLRKREVPFQEVMLPHMPTNDDVCSNSNKKAVEEISVLYHLNPVLEESIPIDEYLSFKAYCAIEQTCDRMHKTVLGNGQLLLYRTPLLPKLVWGGHCQASVPIHLCYNWGESIISLSGRILYPALDFAHH
jgi:hypothetical protein